MKTYKILTGFTVTGMQEAMNILAAEGYLYEPGSLFSVSGGTYTLLMSRET